MIDMLWQLAQDTFWAGIAACSFALVFNVPRRTLLGCTLAGALGLALRNLLLHQGWEIETATLFGAVLIGVLGEWFARRWHAPATIFTISGAIPMAPGTFAFRTMIGVIEVARTDQALGGAVLIEASINAIKTALILGAIAVGIAAPTLLFGRRHPTP